MLWSCWMLLMLWSRRTSSFLRPTESYCQTVQRNLLSSHRPAKLDSTIDNAILNTINRFTNYNNTVCYTNILQCVPKALLKFSANYKRVNMNTDFRTLWNCSSSKLRPEIGLDHQEEGKTKIFWVKSAIQRMSEFFQKFRKLKHLRIKQADAYPYSLDISNPWYYTLLFFISYISSYFALLSSYFSLLCSKLNFL